MSSLFYNGDYSFFKNPISALGMICSYEGLPNIVSHIIFSLTCITASFCLFAAHSAHSTPALFIAAAGLMLMPLPCDRLTLAHQIASALTVGGSYFYCTGYLLKRKSRIELLFFQICILVYAWAHLSGSIYKEELQTFAVLAVFIIMAQSVIKHEYGHSESVAAEFQNK